jgi:predicted alpha-1,2-mannosidase
MKHSAETSEKDLKQYKLKGSLVVDVSFYRYASGFDHYQKYGYISQHFVNNSVSKTLEYAYNDWCIAQMSKALGDEEGYSKFLQRAANYRNLFDPVTGFMRPRHKKGFLPFFDPYRVTQSYTEANAWQYSFYVPHDISGHIKLLGGKEKLALFLDTLFNASPKLKGLIKMDVSGMMGQYAHGNEPSHQIAYEYNYAGQPWKTQTTVRNIMDAFYADEPDGLAGNEDCGQMSAWYVFSSLGFYPVCPGSDQYAIGSPLFRKATIHLENGKAFTIQTTGNSKENQYIKDASLNGSDLTRSYLRYEDIANGGLLEMNMSDQPDLKWGTAEGDLPFTSIE